MPLDSLHCFRCGESPIGDEEIDSESGACPSCGEASVLSLAELMDLLNDLYRQGKFELPKRNRDND